MTLAASAYGYGEVPAGELRDREPREPVVLGLLSAPGLSYELAEDLARRLPSRLRRFPNVRWSVQARIEPMAAASDQDVDLVEVAHQRLLEEGWKLAVCLTDFPVHVGSHPVTAYASATHGVGLVSVPALGAVNLEERVEEAVLRLVEGLLGESADDAKSAGNAERYVRVRRRLEELASPVGRADVQEDRSVRFVTAVGRGNLRLLRHGDGGERVVLFTMATALTVTIGVLTLFLAMFLINIAASAILLSPDTLGRQVDHDVGVSDYLAFSCLVASLATLGGALGAALENDRAVREAAYDYRPDARTEAAG